MNYRYNKNKKRKRIFYSILIVFILLGLFTPVYSYLYDLVEGPFSSLYTNTAELKKDSNNFFGTWVSKKKLIEENERLENKIAILEVDNLRTKYLESLLEKTNLVIDDSKSRIFGSVLKKNNAGTITITGGLVNGLNVNDSVVSYDETLIGKISHVFDKSSQVDLFTKNSVISFGILFPHDLSIKMIGNGNAMVSEVNRDVDVSLGDIVYSQDKSAYIIGVVSAIDFDPRDPFKLVYVSPINNINNLQNVGIIKTTTE